MQIVYISSRHRVLEETLPLVAEYMQFIDSVVVVIPQSQRNEFEAIKSPFPLILYSDEEACELNTRELQSMDHASRNYRIRMSLPALEHVDEEFIMSDDDYRPLSSVDFSLFIHGGKYRSFAYYDMTFWSFGSSSFDMAQRNTCQLLKHKRLPNLAYASHMPQIFNKRMLKSCAEYFRTSLPCVPLCEWGIYFNYCHFSFPDSFYPTEKFKTLCWPETVSSWPKMIIPDEYIFENYAPGLYEKGGPFYRLEDRYSDQLETSLQKTMAWSEYESAVLRGEKLESRIWFKPVASYLIRILKRLKEVVFLQERHTMYSQIGERLNLRNGLGTDSREANSKSKNDD